MIVCTVVVGAYASDYGFSLPNPVSMCSEFLWLRLEKAWRMQTLQKIEDTWCETLWHYDVEFDSTLRVFKGWWYGRCFAQSDGDPNLLGANRNDDGCWLNAYYDKPDNRWNRDNGFAFSVSQLSSFLLRSGGGVLFGELSIPPTEHLACFIKRHRKRNIFRIIQRLTLPENQQKDFERVQLAYREPHPRHLFVLR